MPKIQQCRNGCNQLVTVQQDNGKWKPFSVDPDGDYLEFNDDGTPRPHNCPKSPYNMNKQQGGGQTYKQSFTSQLGRSTTTNPVPKDIPKYTQGGQALDTKRERVMIEELSNHVQALTGEVLALRQVVGSIKEAIENNLVLDTGRYENQMNVIYEAIAPFLTTQKNALQMLNEEREGGTESINHSKIADNKQNFMQPKKDRPRTKFVDETKEGGIPFDSKIPDDHDEFAVAQALKGDDEEEGGIIED